MSAVSEAVNTALTTLLKLDIGCGKNKQAGFVGIDIYNFPGVDVVADLRKPRWRSQSVPADLVARVSVDNAFVEEGVYSFADNSVDQVHCSHFLEHLTNLDDRWERVNFFNELHRIMKPGATAQLIFPHWSSSRYYGDPTHKEPFSEMGFCYLNRQWRLDQGNAPHADISVNKNGYSCDFDWTYGYGLHPHLLTRNQEYQQHALTFWKEAATDIVATITKRPPA
jgi:SAM-dependent methyltransferase